MTTIADFYGNLLTTQITIVGILFASIFVIVQLVYSSFSHEPLRFIFRNWTFRAYVAFTILSLISSVMPYCLLLFPEAERDAELVQIIQGRGFITASMVMFFIPVFIFLRLMYETIGLLRPIKIIENFERTFDFENLRKFLRRKYGIHEPAEPNAITVIIASPDTPEGKEEIVSKNYEGDFVDAKRKFAQDRRRAELVKEVSVNSFDELAFIGDIAIGSIKKADFQTVSKIGDLILDISKRSWIELQSCINPECWSPDRDLRTNYIKHVLELCELLREVSKKEGFATAENTVVLTSNKLSDELFSDTTSAQRYLFYSYWKRVANDSINRSPVLFRNAVLYLRKNGEREFDNSEESSLDEIFRILGWLGERLLSQSELKEPEYMLESEFSTEYAELYEALFEFSERFSDDRPNSYPLIFFDAIMVIFRHVVIQYRRAETQYLKEQIQSFIYALESFAARAIENNNIRGAELATMRLLEQYDRLAHSGLRSIASEVVSPLLDIAFLSAGRPDVDRSESMLGRRLHKWILDEVLKRDEKGTIIRQMSWRAPKYIPNFDYDSHWKFIKEVAREVGSNFGYMFDATTGEDYGPDDPRRGKV